jgi:hypothetical protein
MGRTILYRFRSLHLGPEPESLLQFKNACSGCWTMECPREQ